MFGMVNFGSINTETTTQQQEFTTKYKKMLTWTNDGLVSQFISLNCLNGTITINKIGNYNVTFSVSFKGTNERNYDLAVFKDGVIQPQVKTQRFFGPNLKTGDVYGVGFVNITSIPAVIDLRAKCDVSDANVMIVENAILFCVEIIPNFTPGTTTGTAGITASTTQTQGQVPLTTVVNEISVVANTNDTITLSTAVPFTQIIIMNNGAKKLQIFPASGDNLGNGVDTSTSLLSGSNIHFVAYDNTNWEMI